MTAVVHVKHEHGDPLVWLESDPGYDHYGGFRVIFRCDKCEAERVPMYGFDSSGGEYSAVYVCVDCMTKIVGVVDK